MDVIRVAGAQLDLTVGDFAANEERILAAMEWAEGTAADVLLLPELAITGYPPEDLVLRDAFVTENREVLDRLAAASGSVVTVVGFVDRARRIPSELDDAVDRHLANAAALLGGGAVRGVYHKRLLPNYGVFDEDRYFVAGPDDVELWDVGGVAVGVSICEDIWVPHGPPMHQAAAGARILLNINGSPYHRGKGAERADLLSSQAVRAGVPLVYLNMVGSQDELVFDGDSMVYDGSGTLVHRSPMFEEDRFVVDVVLPPARETTATPVSVRLSGAAVRPDIPPPRVHPALPEEEEVYRALVCGLGGYVRKNGFTEVVVGLSGGIDSALTAAIAVDALGPGAVLGVTMPSRHSSEGSISDSEDLARRLGCRFTTVPIETVYSAFLETLQPQFTGTEPGVAEENLQARIRGAILMALSNKFGGMVVATGNKSEMAVGYATLYGDMAGGFAVLKDVFKTLAYRMAEWRNSDGEVIPRAIITKPPSAELRPDQLDTDSLPPYDLLDGILERYVELDRAIADIVADGFDEATVRRVAAMVDHNEYKRRQAAPGVKITPKAFGRDRRLPITNRFRG
jgi:NAD+ synthase (glutamine-hydrolysing)